MNLLVAAAIAKSASKNHSHHRSRRRSQWDQQSHRFEYDDDDAPIPYVKYLIKELSYHNPDLLNFFLKLKDSIEQVKKEYIDFKKTNLHEIYSKALEKMNISKEELDKIFKSLDNVAIEMYGDKYDMKSYSSAKEGAAEYIKPILEWFISEIYEADPNFVKRNIPNHNIKNLTLNNLKYELDHGNSILKDFFSKLEDTKNSLIREIEDEAIAKANVYIDQAKEKYSEINEITVKLNKLGIKLSEKSELFARNETFIIFTCFNGLPLTKEELTTPHNQKYKTIYETCQKNNEKFYQEEVALRKTLQKKEKILKFSLFGKKNQLGKIYSIKEKLMFIEKKKKEEECKRINSEFFENLTQEQKDLMIEYLEKCEELKKCLTTMKQIQNPKININNERKKALIKILEDEKISPEYFDKVSEALAKIAIKNERAEYEYYSAGYYSFSYTNTLSWFIDEIWSSNPNLDKNLDR